MDFLDSLDLDITNKKYHRVRSWYMLEQYKSLERSQLIAAHKLRERCYQDNILLTELRERKTRRGLCSQCSLSHRRSDCSRLYKTISIATKTPSDLTTDELYESFCDDDDIFTPVDDQFDDDEPNESETGRVEFDSVNNDEDCRLETVPSVIEVKSFETLAGSQEGETEQKSDTADNIPARVDVVNNLEKFASFVDVEMKMKEVKDSDLVKEAVHSDCMILLWSRLVSFAYQVTKLNRGNCYSDYSTQFLTAVLACDILRLGVHKMSHILQRYISPVKFSSDDESTCSESIKIQIRRPRKKRIKSSPLPLNKGPCNGRKRVSSSRRADVQGNNHSGCCNDPFEKNASCWVPRTVSAPESRRILDGIREIQWEGRGDWPEDTGNSPFGYKTENPMLKVIAFIEDVMQLEGEGEGE